PVQFGLHVRHSQHPTGESPGAGDRWIPQGVVPALATRHFFFLCLGTDNRRTRLSRGYGRFHIPATQHHAFALAGGSQCCRRGRPLDTTNSRLELVERKSSDRTWNRGRHPSHVVRCRRRRDRGKQGNGSDPCKTHVRSEEHTSE